MQHVFFEFWEPLLRNFREALHLELKAPPDSRPGPSRPEASGSAWRAACGACACARRAGGLSGGGFRV